MSALVALVSLSGSEIADILAGLSENDHWWGETPETNALRARLQAEPAYIQHAAAREAEFQARRAADLAASENEGGR